MTSVKEAEYLLLWKNRLKKPKYEEAVVGGAYLWYTNTADRKQGVFWFRQGYAGYRLQSSDYVIINSIKRKN